MDNYMVQGLYRKGIEKISRSVRYHGVLEHALSKEDFSVGTGTYMRPSDLNLSTRKTKGYNNKILVSNTDMKIGSNKDINKDHKKLPVNPPDNDMLKIVIPAAQYDNLKMLTEKHNDEKVVITLLIKGAGLSCLVESKWHHYYSQSVVLCLMH